MKTNRPVVLGRSVSGLLHPDSVQLATTLSRNTDVTLSWEVITDLGNDMRPITEVHAFGSDEEVVRALLDVLAFNIISNPEGS